MTRDQLVDRLAEAIAKHEGFFVTAQQARARGIKYPTMAQRNANPGNIRQWKDGCGRPYPKAGGYVDFVSWAMEPVHGVGSEQIMERALAEGWRVLKRLVLFYVNGRYTKGASPSLRLMFAVYAPASDGNDPESYARFVAECAGLPIDSPLKNCHTPA